MASIRTKNKIHKLLSKTCKTVLSYTVLAFMSQLAFFYPHVLSCTYYFVCIIMYYMYFVFSLYLPITGLVRPINGHPEGLLGCYFYRVGGCTADNVKNTQERYFVGYSHN